MTEKQDKRELAEEVEQLDLEKGEEITDETLLNLSDNKGRDE